MTPLAERPGLAGEFWGSAAAAWPEFMTQDPISGLYYGDCAQDYPDLVLVATDDTGAVAGRAFAAPFAGGWDGRPEFPDDGWDAVIRWQHADRLAGRPATAISALEISIPPRYRGAGLSAVLLAAMRSAAAARGVAQLIAPVRPSAKAAEPRTPIAGYATRRRADGLPADPWLRTHVRAGGEIVGVAPVSMVIPGTLAQWRDWTGLPFDGPSGPVLVPDALVPVQVDAETGTAVYVEPNVWVRHRLP